LAPARSTHTFPRNNPTFWVSRNAMNREQFNKVRLGDGFIAALDQSGGSTPKALKLYGVGENAYSNEQEMYDRIHEMRTRIITSPAFDGDRVMGAILFENTMDRDIKGRGTADYLWAEKGVVPFLKVDKGLLPETNGVQLMKPMGDLDRLLERARQKGVFGTKMRSVILRADAGGIQSIADQQFEVGRQILEAGLVPILEPEVDIKSPDKAMSEQYLKQYLLAGLETIGDDQFVMFKVTLPEQDDFYRELVDHPKVLKVVALSGGYTRDEANAKLARNPGVVASFSRALTEGLRVDQSDEEFNRALDQAIQSIYEASVA
jgi:fructose-bisphosphate aldolase, class I